MHDDVIKWKHFTRYWSFVRGIHRSPDDSPHKSHWRGALIFSLICAWTNGWANKGNAGDLRRHVRSLWRHCNVVEIMGCRLFGVNSYLNKCWIIVKWPWEQNSTGIWIRIQQFSFKEMILKRSVKWWTFCPGLNVLHYELSLIPILKKLPRES